MSACALFFSPGLRVLAQPLFSARRVPKIPKIAHRRSCLVKGCKIEV